MQVVSRVGYGVFCLVGGNGARFADIFRARRHWSGLGHICFPSRGHASDLFRTFVTQCCWLCFCAPLPAICHK